METPKQAYSVPEFCAAHSISRAAYYQLKKRGLAPEEIHIGSKPIISVEAAAAWRARMMKKTAAA